MSRPILIVDDDPGVRDLLFQLLSEEGYEILTAANGAEALEMVERICPAVILLDLNMPVMTGWEFAEEYRRRQPDCAPIVVMTAGGSVNQKAAEVRAAAHLGKPFDIDDLLHLVGRLAQGTIQRLGHFLQPHGSGREVAV